MGQVIYTCHYCGKEAVFGEHFCKEARKVRKLMKRGDRADGNPGPGLVRPENPGAMPGLRQGPRRAEPHDPDQDLGFGVPDQYPGSGSRSGPGSPGGRTRRMLGSLASSLVAGALVAALLFGSLGSLAWWIIPLALLIGLTVGMLAKPPGAGRRFRQLLSLVGGDQELAQRLVLSEAGRNPGLHPDALVDLAIQRLLRDRLR